MSRQIFRYSGIGMLVAALAFVGLAVADDPEGPDEPPVRLKKKIKPKKDEAGDQNPEAVSKDGKPKKDGGEAKKDGDGGKLQPRGEDERKKLVKRVLKNLRDAEGRLAKKDPGKTTRKIQKDILKDLDALIQQTRQQPPPQQNQRQRQRQQNQRNSKNQRNSRNQNKPQNNPNQAQQPDDKSTRPNQGQPGQDKTGGRGGDSKKKDSNADLFKNPWGHLPEKERQKIDEYTRAGNIPDYETLQQEYERTLAEEGTGKQGD